MPSDSLGFCMYANPKNMLQGFTGCISYMTDQSAHLLFVKLCACRTYLFVNITHPGISRVLGVWDCIATRLLFYRSQNNVSPALEILAASICLFPPFVASFSPPLLLLHSQAIETVYLASLLSISRIGSLTVPSFELSII